MDIDPSVARLSDWQLQLARGLANRMADTAAQADAAYRQRSLLALNLGTTKKYFAKPEGELALCAYPELPAKILLAMEHEVTGTWVTEHPLQLALRRGNT